MSPADADQFFLAAYSLLGLAGVVALLAVVAVGRLAWRWVKNRRGGK